MRMARGGRPAGAAAAAHEEALPAAPFYGRISCAQCRRRLQCTCSAHTVALLLVLAVVSTEYGTRIELVGKIAAAVRPYRAATVTNLRVNSRIQRYPYNSCETEKITNVGTVVALDHRSIPRSMLPRLSTKGDAFIVDYSGQVPFHPIMYANVLGKKENERETQCREVNERVTIFPVFACNAVYEFMAQTLPACYVHFELQKQKTDKVGALVIDSTGKTTLATCRLAQLLQRYDPIDLKTVDCVDYASAVFPPLQPPTHEYGLKWSGHYGQWLRQSLIPCEQTGNPKSELRSTILVDESLTKFGQILFG